MPISLGQFPDLTKNAKVKWDMERMEFDRVREQIAIIDGNVVERTSEHNSGVSSMQTARRRDDGDDAYKGTLKQGYTSTFTQAEIALQADVTKGLRKFDKYGEINKRMRGMARGAERRMELDVAAHYSYAWATSYTNIDGETVSTAAPDGLALMSPSHTVNGGSDTYSTEIDTTHDEFSADVLERMEEIANGFLDDSDGRGIPGDCNTIITGRHAPTRNTVTRLLSSELLAGTANNDKNNYRASYRHIVVPFLDYNMQTEQRDSTKAKYAFIAHLGSEDYTGLLVEVSQDIMFEAPTNVTASSTWEYLTTAYYDLGLTRANWIVGTKGDSTTV